MIFTEKQFKKALSDVLSDVMYGKEHAKDKFDRLSSEIAGLKVELKDLEIKKEKDQSLYQSRLDIIESKRKIDEEEIKHLVKMKEEKLLLETSRKEIELQKLFTQREMDLQIEYHDKVLKTIEDSRRESKELYNKIMERLPNVNMEIKRRQ